MRKRTALLLSILLCLSLSLSVVALENDQLSFVTDEAGILTDAEWVSLIAKAEQDSGECGIYIIILSDYTDYSGGSVRQCAEALYTACDLGAGAEADGILLLLSMEDRDYAIIGHGSLGRSAVNRVNDDAFLDDFAENDWYAGFVDYIDECADAIALGEIHYSDIGGADGPQAVIVSGPPGLSGQTFLYIVLGSCAVSAIICLILLAGMKTAKRQTAADAYVPERGVKMRVTTDRYTHTTRSVRHVPRNNSSGGSRGGGGGRSGGFSGRSGKF